MPCMHCIYINLYTDCSTEFVPTDRPIFAYERICSRYERFFFFKCTAQGKYTKEIYVHKIRMSSTSYTINIHHLTTTTQEFTIRASSMCVRKYFNSFALPYRVHIVWGGCFCGHRIISIYTAQLRTFKGWQIYKSYAWWKWKNQTLFERRQFLMNSRRPRGAKGEATIFNLLIQIICVCVCALVRK